MKEWEKGRPATTHQIAAASNVQQVDAFDSADESRTNLSSFHF